MRTDASARARLPGRGSQRAGRALHSAVATFKVLVLLVTGLVGLLGLLLRFLLGAYLVALAIFFALSSPRPRLPWRRRPRLFRPRRFGW